VKNWTRPVDSGVVRNSVKKGIREIISKSGFTDPAKKLAERKKIKLISRGRTKKK